MKSSFGMILNQMKYTECLFLCETWLKPSELGTIRNELNEHEYWSYLKWSVDPEVVLQGCPYGGVGFICRKLPGLSYRSINCDNDRLCALQILSDHKVLLTVIGVYMPYVDGTTNQLKAYSETLDDIQCIIDTNDPSPIMFVGDMNGTKHVLLTNITFYCMILCVIMNCTVVTLILHRVLNTHI